MTLCEWAPQALATALLEPALCEVRVGSQFVVHENDALNDGAAEVTLRLPVYAPALLLHGASHSTGYFRFIKNQKCADGALLVELGERRYAGYLLECKRTVNPGKLADVKGQLAGALCKLRAIVGLLEGHLIHLHYYTAYRIDDMRKATDAGTIHHRQRVGRPVAEAPSDEWPGSEITLPMNGDRAARIPHRPVLLEVRDGIGRAFVDLSLPSA